MEVSGRALGLLATVAIGASVVLMARETAVDRVRYQRRSPAWTAVGALEDSVARLGLRVQAREARQRVDSVMRAYPGGTPPRLIVIGGGDAASVAPMADSMLGSMSLPAAPGIPLRAALIEVSATWPTRPIRIRSFTMLPESSSAPACTSVRLMSPGSLDRKEEALLWQRMPWDGAVGPCWYLAMFGEPGPAIRRWLDARYWDVAGVIPPHLRRTELGDAFEPSSNLIYRMLGDLGGMYAGGSVTLQGCASDKPALCEAALFGSPYPKGLLPEGIVGTERVLAFAPERFQWQTGLPAWASRQLLAMMVEDLGPARFSAFWTSRDSLAEAFHKASGVPFAEWYRTQLRQDLQQAGFAVPGNTIVWPSALGLLVLTFVASLMGARRRQVR